MARKRGRKAHHEVDSVAVLGLGRFGRALALELMHSGIDVLGIDRDEEIVQSLNGMLTHVVCADSTNEAVLDQLDVDSFERVVIAIGTDLEASILTASVLKRRNRCEIWAKAISEQHGLILQQLGIPHVVSPEADMGRRVAHLVQGRMIDFVALDDDLAVAVTTTPAAVAGRPLDPAQVHARHHVSVLAVRTATGWQREPSGVVLEPGQTIAVTGHPHSVERFSAQE